MCGGGGGLINEIVSAPEKLAQTAVRETMNAGETAATIGGNVAQDFGTSLTNPKEYYSKKAKKFIDNPEKILPYAAAYFVGLPPEAGEAAQGTEYIADAADATNLADAANAADVASSAESLSTASDLADTASFITPEAPYAELQTAVDFSSPISTEIPTLKEALGTAKNVYQGSKLISSGKSPIPTAKTGTKMSVSRPQPDQFSQAANLSQEQKIGLRNIAMSQVLNKYARMGRNPWADTSAQQEINAILSKYA